MGSKCVALACVRVCMCVCVCVRVCLYVCVCVSLWPTGVHIVLRLKEVSLRVFEKSYCVGG